MILLRLGLNLWLGLNLLRVRVLYGSVARWRQRFYAYLYMEPPAADLLKFSE